MKTNKIPVVLTALAVLSSLGSCSTPESSVSSSSQDSSTAIYTNSLSKMFGELKKNDFSIDFSDSYLNYNNVERYQTFYYTPYAFQSDGDFGFKGIAQGDEMIFSYTLDAKGNVYSSAPLVSSSTGLRYDTVYDFYSGLNKIDPTVFNDYVVGDDGFYTYVYGENATNDFAFSYVLLRYGMYANAIAPEEVKMKVNGSSLTIKARMRTYEIDDRIGYDYVNATVYDIGNTANAEIKAYLDGGKTAKDPLDIRLFKFFTPYMSSHNYKVYCDASGMTTEDRNYKVTQYFTDDAVYYDFPADSANTDSGQVLASGVVNNFNLDSEGKLNVTYTPTDSDGNFYTSIYGDVVAYSFSDLYFDNIVGYKDETDDDVYYITDSQAVFTLAYISMIETSDSFYTDKARIEITDFDKREFTVSFDITNKTLNSSLGTYVAKFSGLNTTDIPAVDRFLNGGKNPTLQTKEEFKTVMEKFKAGNYSMNALTSSGLAKYYFTDKYFYEELFSNADSNIGYLKQDGHIYSFTIASNKITVDKSTDHAAGNSPMTLPGVGSSFFASDDLGYISHFSDEIYNYDNYEVTTNSGITYWKNMTSGFSTKMFNYVFKNATSILPLGSGFIVSDSEDPFDTRVSLISAFRAADGSYDNYYEYTYYDIGNTSYKLIDDYLASL